MNVLPTIYPDDGPTVGKPKNVVAIGEPTVTDALRALAKMPRAADGQQRVVVVDTRHPAFASLDFDLVATALAEGRVIALTDVEARRVGFHPADADALGRLHRDGLLVADVPTSTIQRAASENAYAANGRPLSRRAPDDVIPAKTLRRRQRLAARAARS